MKRVYRNDMAPEQKAAISRSLSGRKHTEDHKQKISKALEKYWAELPAKPQSDQSDNRTTSEKIFGEG